jgi:hypothetical protein
LGTFTLIYVHDCQMIKQRFPCPNCASLWSGPHAVCGRCGYPRHERPKAPPREQTIKPFRFDLRTLLACVTDSAVMFALLGASSDARDAALAVGGVLYPVINYLYQFWRSLAEPEPRAKKRGPFDDGG